MCSVEMERRRSRAFDRRGTVRCCASARPTQNPRRKIHDRAERKIRAPLRNKQEIEVLALGRGFLTEANKDNKKGLAAVDRPIELERHIVEERPAGERFESWETVSIAESAQCPLVRCPTTTRIERADKPARSQKKAQRSNCTNQDKLGYSLSRSSMGSRFRFG